MKGLRTRLIMVGVEVVLILVLHAMLKRWMADSHVAAVILSAGPHVPRTVLAGAGLFVAVRLFAVFFLPALVLAHLGGIAYDYVTRPKERPPGGEPPA